MWALLSDSEHADRFDQFGEAYVPLRRLVEDLAHREYAGRVYAFKSQASFNLTTAPTEQEAAGHDGIGIEYDPELGCFRVGYSEWAHVDRALSIRNRGVRVCNPHEIGDVIDNYAQRLMQSRKPEKAESVVENLLIFALFAGMLVYAVCWTLSWFGLPLLPIGLASMGVVGLSIGLLSIGQALLPNWERPLWRRAPRRMSTVRMGRLVLLGVGISFGAGGVVFVWAPWVEELPQPFVWVFVAAIFLGMVLVLVGLQFDRRRVKAVWALEDAKRTNSRLTAS